LHEQQFVDGGQNQGRRGLGNGALQLGAARRCIAQLGTVAQLGNLPLLELGLGDDVPVDLYQHLLQHLGSEWCDEQGGQEKGGDGGQALEHCNSFELSILP
jgi:hypothetical protein